MTNCLSARRRVLLASVLGFAMTAGGALAQSPPGFSELDQTHPANPTRPAGERKLLTECLRRLYGPGAIIHGKPRSIQ